MRGEVLRQILISLQKYLFSVRRSSNLGIYSAFFPQSVEITSPLNVSSRILRLKNRSERLTRSGPFKLFKPRWRFARTFQNSFKLLQDSTKIVFTTHMYTDFKFSAKKMCGPDGNQNPDLLFMINILTTKLSFRLVNIILLLHPVAEIETRFWIPTGPYIFQPRI